MTTNTNHITSRWSRVERAIGFTAGIAVTLAAGYMFAASITEAAGSAQESTFVPVTPCRLFDTRPAPDNVGPRNTPLGANDTHVQQVTGQNGQCDIPVGATAVAINATAVGATAPSFVTFFPSDGDLPVASNLNVGPGQAATPNKVDVKLSIDGRVSVYNAFGQVNMIADVTGYYTDATLDELETMLGILNAEQPFSVEATSSSLVANAIETTPETVLSIDILAPAAGNIVANYATIVRQDDAGETVECAINRNTSLGTTALQRFESPGADGGTSTLSGTRMLSVTAGEQITVYLNCRSSDASASTLNSLLNATFTPAAG
jgi:hypothetical protein